MPDISLSLSNSHLIEEYSFHPSVRLSVSPRTASSFVPADGTFTLMSYKVKPPADWEGREPALAAQVHQAPTRG